MLVAEALEFAEVLPQGEHLALLLLGIGHHDRLEFAEEVGLLQALEGAVQLTLLHQVVDGLHALGRVLDRLAGEHVEGFEGRDEVGDREELLHFLGADDDVLAAALEEDAVEAARDQRVAVAAGHQERDHLGLELDLGLQAERGHLGVLGEDLGLRARLVLHLEGEFGGSGRRLAEGLGLRGGLGAGVVGFLDGVGAVDDDAFLHLAERLQLRLVDLDLAELLLHGPDLLDLRGDGQRAVAVDVEFSRLEEQVEGFLLVAIVVLLVDGLRG